MSYTVVRFLPIGFRFSKYSVCRMLWTKLEVISSWCGFYTSSFKWVKNFSLLSSFKASLISSFTFSEMRTFTSWMRSGINAKLVGCLE